MEKELKIQVHINSNFEIEANPNLKDWTEASIPLFIQTCCSFSMNTQI